MATVMVAATAPRSSRFPMRATGLSPRQGSSHIVGERSNASGLSLRQPGAKPVVPALRHGMASLWEQLNLGCSPQGQHRISVAPCGAPCVPRTGALPDARRLPHAPAGVALCDRHPILSKGGTFLSGPVKPDRASWWSRPRHGHPRRGGVGLPVTPGPVPAGNPRGRRASPRSCPGGCAASWPRLPSRADLRRAPSTRAVRTRGPALLRHGSPGAGCRSPRNG